MVDTYRHRCFHVTPGSFLLGLLAIEGCLLLSEWFDWFPKGWAVLIAVASVGLAMLFMLLWSVAALLFRWRFQFSVWSLMVLVVAIAIPSSWLAVEMEWAREQREVVEGIKDLSGSITYDYEVDPSDKPLVGAEPSGPVWLRNLLGGDFFAEVVGVGLWGTKVTDGSLEHLKSLTELRALNLNNTLITDSMLAHLTKWRSRLQYLYLDYTQITNLGLEHLQGLTQLRVLGLNDTRISDAGLEHLRGLTQLQELILWDTRISDAGLEHLKELTRLQSLNLLDTQVTGNGVMKLQQALPNCKIEWQPPTKNERQDRATLDQPGG